MEKARNDWSLDGHDHSMRQFYSSVLSENEHIPLKDGPVDDIMNLEVPTKLGRRCSL